MSVLHNVCKVAALRGCLILGQAARTRPRLKRARTLFMTYGCFQCHGTVGQGGNAGPRLAPNPLPTRHGNFVRTTNRQMPLREAVLPNEVC